jgi:hypothetical protein
MMVLHIGHMSRRGAITPRIERPTQSATQPLDIIALRRGDACYSFVDGYMVEKLGDRLRTRWTFAPRQLPLVLDM